MKTGILCRILDRTGPITGSSYRI